MLPPFIIEQIRRREEDARHNQRPHLELPLPMPPPPPRVSVPDDDEGRGVIIIELGWVS